MPFAFAQKKGIASLSSSVNTDKAVLVLDGNNRTGWELSAEQLQHEQFLMFTFKPTMNDSEMRVFNNVSSFYFNVTFSHFLSYNKLGYRHNRNFFTINKIIMP